MNNQEWEGVDRRAELRLLCSTLYPDQRMTEEEMDALVDPYHEGESLEDILAKFSRELEAEGDSSRQS